MSSSTRSKTRPSYHHGTLRQALIDATESLLAERGLDGFSLREVARRSGVSPAAPAHHFGDAQGLLTAVATLAFDGLAEALQAGNARGGGDAVARLREQGVGYVGFALRFPGRFRLMFGPCNQDDEGLARSARAAFEVLENGVRDLLGVAPGQPLAPEQTAALLSIWSVVHGFAHLLIGGQLDQPAGDAGRQGFAASMVGPMLQLQLDGLVHSVRARPPAARPAAKARKPKSRP
jgi:AcrR family transcriptional regulator